MPYATWSAAPRIALAKANINIIYAYEYHPLIPLMSLVAEVTLAALGLTDQTYRQPAVDCYTIVI